MNIALNRPIPTGTLPSEHEQKTSMKLTSTRSNRQVEILVMQSHYSPNAQAKTNEIKDHNRSAVWICSAHMDFVEGGAVCAQPSNPSCQTLQHILSNGSQNDSHFLSCYNCWCCMLLLSLATVTTFSTRHTNRYHHTSYAQCLVHQLQKARCRVQLCVCMCRLLNILFRNQIGKRLIFRLNFS